MKAKELRQKPIIELNKELEEKRKSLEKIQIDLVTKKAKNYSQVKDIKKDIARILTIISEKQFLNQEGKQNDR